MSELYGRRCSLIVGDENGNGLELSEFRVKFLINRADVQSPANADIRIYNLSDDTMSQIREEFTHVFLQGGYEANFGLLFNGKVRQFRKGRENPTDTYLDILAQDGDEGYNYAVMNTTLPGGWNQDEMHAEIVKAFDPFGVVEGYKPTFGGPALPRGRVMYGMARDYMRTLAEGAGASWHIADGQINVIPLASTLPGDAIVINSASGMIGIPQQTINGVTVRALINPRIKHGGTIQLNNADIQQQPFNISYNPGLANNTFSQDGTGNDVVTNTGFDTDGNYKVYSITMTGDTRGQEWYFDIVCVGIDATAPLAGPYINATASSTGF